MGKSFSQFEAMNRNSVPLKLMTIKYGRRSASAEDDAQYRRELEIATDVTLELLKNYHDWIRP